MGALEGDVLDDPLLRPLDARSSDKAAAEPDPWAHRRGEPRLFAFFWTVYVFAAVAGSVLWLARTGGWLLGGYGAAGRIMLVVVAVGATVLWPMTRLSQASPGTGAVRAMLADIAVVLLPLQMVIWPMTWLAGWPLRSVAAIAALLGAWVLVVGGILAVALGGRAVEQARDPGLRWRAAWMAALVVVGLAGPVALSAYRNSHPPVWAPMISPVTGVLSLTGTGLAGPQTAVTPSQWLAIATLSVVALGWWTLGVARAVLPPRRQSA